MKIDDSVRRVLNIRSVEWLEFKDEASDIVGNMTITDKDKVNMMTLLEYTFKSADYIREKRRALSDEYHDSAMRKVFY